MNPANSCPTAEQIDDLLTNRLSATEAENLRQHLRACPACLSRINDKPGDAARYPFLSPPLAAGELGWLGSFRVLGVLGQGGMAVVFDAEDTLLNRRVAVKVLRPDISDETLRQRFVREAQVLASVSHEHIVSIFQVGEANRIAYIAMERLEGMTLAERLEQDHWLPLSEALNIAAQAAEGLVVAHQHNLVHRDVKPANIWLETRNGRFRRVKLIDFGIACLVGGNSKLTRAGQVLGTPIYMAPEQAEGRPVDGRTDLYSLGCVLYQMLTGQPPGASSYPTQTLLKEIVAGQVTVVRERGAQLPPAVASFIQQLLQKQLEQRPASAAVAAQRLRQLEQETRLDATPQAPAHFPPAIQRRSRRSRVGILLGGLALAAALLVGVVAACFKFWSIGSKSANLPTIKIGVLHSLRGINSAQERPIIHALQLAVKTINSEGGVLSRELEIIEGDGDSDEERFARKARELILDQKVVVLFGCWTAGSRRRVAEVCEKEDRLLFCPAATEGLESSPCVVSLGGTPRQTAVPLVEWFCKKKDKPRFYLLGSQSVYSRVLFLILEHELAERKALLAGQHLMPANETNLAPLAEEIKKSGADVILNTITGPENQTLLRELRKAELGPEKVSIAWINVDENELSLFPIDALVGDYAPACYFSSLDRPENATFLERYRKAYGEKERINDDMQTAYASVFLWKQAVEKAARMDTGAVRQALRGLTVDAPVGPIRIDPNTQYAYRTAFIGQIVNGKPLSPFRIVYTSDEPLAPEPYPTWKSRVEWDKFLKEIYEGWGRRWEKER
jgi:urea transport system substrate-binding protein